MACTYIIFDCSCFITHLPERLTIISVPLLQNSSQRFFPSKVISIALFSFTILLLFFGGSLALVVNATPLTPSSTEGVMAQLLLLFVFCGYGECTGIWATAF